MAKSVTATKTASKTLQKAAKVKPEKTAKKEKTITIKYADKSAGQPELLLIFEKIKSMLVPYHKKRDLLLHTDTGGQANLVSHKAVMLDGKQRAETWFASALIQKGYVGFYFTPINIHTPLRKMISPALLKCLKGKSCFRITKNEPALLADIKQAIQLGYEALVAIERI